MNIEKDLWTFCNETLLNTVLCGNTYYIEKEKLRISFFWNQIRIVNIQDALTPGKYINVYTFEGSDYEGEHIEVSLINHFNCDSQKLYKFFKEFQKDFTLDSIPNFLVNGEHSKHYISEIKSNRVFSPFAKFNPVKPNKWTITKVVKAILNDQIVAGHKKAQYTDDYAFDNSTNFSKGNKLDLLSFAESLVNTPGGWRVNENTSKSNEKNIFLNVNCHNFDYNELVFVN